MNVREVPGGVRARWRGFGLRALPRVLAVAGWNGFLAAWYGLAAGVPGGPGWRGWLPLLHVAAGLWLGGLSLRWLLNWTELQISPTRVRCVTGPLPRARAVECAPVDLVACELVRAPRFSECQDYLVRVILASGEVLPLCRVPDALAGARLVRLLGRRLGLQDATGSVLTPPAQGRT